MKPNRVVKIIAIIAGSAVGICVASVAILFLSVRVWAHWPFNWPSDKNAELLFRNHRSDFVALVEMVHDDRNMESIRKGWLRSKGQSAPLDYHWTTNSGISMERWAEYKREFKKIGLRDGLSIEDNGTIQFHLAVIGTLVIAPCSYKDLIYKPESLPWGIGTNIVASLEDDALPKDRGYVRTGYYVKRLEPDWYLARLETD